ncbi:thymidine phosphorylase [bacterium]|nr:thymidine phosphorylase [bacterium]
MPNLSPYHFITEKQSGREHLAADIAAFIDGFVKGRIPDYQMTAWMMAVYFKGMTSSETLALTEAMLRSGETVTHDSLLNPIVDKHSTGGVGDKITLILAPMLAALGLAVPTITGRGLAFTGGTTDKFNSIPGFRSEMNLDDFKHQVADIGLAFVSQSSSLAPADGRMYALRDVTGTVQSLPLIISSILCKKIAEGIQGIVFDVKCGSGAFMDRVPYARQLAEGLVHVGTSYGLDSVAVITRMDTPLGLAVGNWLEVIESVRYLRAETTPPDLHELTLSLGSALMQQVGAVKHANEARAKLEQVRDSGHAWERFQSAVERQGGDLRTLDTLEHPLKPQCKSGLEAPKDGIIHAMDAREIGFAAVDLHAGRRRVDDEIDPTAGIVLHRKTGDRVTKGDLILEVQAADQELCDQALQRARSAITIKEHQPTADPLIVEVVTPEGTMPAAQYFSA